MFDDVSNFVNSVDVTFLFTLVISVFFLVLITILMIVFVIKYNRKRNPRGTNIHGNMALEITWIVIPTILVLVMFWFGWEGYLETVDVPENAMPVNVTAQMWKWSFEYEDGKTTDTLYVPVNQPVKLILNSVDVNHSFFIPAFRLKKDVFPNRERIAWFQAKEIGEYDIACSEYCGLNHSYMYSKIIVLSDEDFNNWMYGLNEEEFKLLNEMTKSDN
jgi:cytochrome c oxidase subunit 2